MLSRRGLITGLISLVAAPAIVRVQNIMPVRRVPDFIILARHPLYDSDEYQRDRLAFYNKSSSHEHWQAVVDHFMPPPHQVWNTSHIVRYDGA